MRVNPTPPRPSDATHTKPNPTIPPINTKQHIPALVCFLLPHPPRRPQAKPPHAVLRVRRLPRRRPLPLLLLCLGLGLLLLLLPLLRTLHINC